MMGLLQLIICILILSPFANSILIRSREVYENTVKDIFKYYDLDSAIFLRTSSNIILSEDIESLTQFKNLQLYFNKLLIQLSIIDVQKFVIEMHENPNKLNKKLIVLLNDSEEMKIQLEKTVFPLIDVSKSTWLMFISDKTEIDDFFSNIHIPFNCEFLVSQKNLSSDDSEVIKEIYRIDKNKDLQQLTFAKWKLNDGMRFPELSFYERRSDLQGHALCLAIIPDTSDIIITVSKDGTIKLSGPMGEILNHLQDKLNFTISYQLIQGLATFFNNMTPKKSERTNSDINCNIFPYLTAITYSKVKIADFTMPLRLAESYFYFKKPMNTFEWKKYLQPFNIDIWFVILCLIVIAGIMITAIQLFYQDRYFKQFIENKESPKVVDNIFLAFGAFCGQAIPRSFIDSVGILQLTIHLTAVIVLAAYSAILISLLAVSSSDMPFRTIEGLFKDDAFKVGFLEGSIYEEYFQGSTNSILKKLYQKSTGKILPLSNKEGIERVCAEDKYAYIGTPYSVAATVESIGLNICTLITSESMFLFSYAFVLEHNSPFREIFNEYISPMISSGVLQRIVNHYSKFLKHQAEDKWTPVEFIDIAPLITLLFIHSIVGISLVMVEKIIHYILMRQKLASISHRLIVNIKYPSDKMCAIDID